MKGKFLDKLNSKCNFTKFRSLKKLVKIEKSSQEFITSQKEIVPLHFSSTANYSLYSPTMCAYLAHKFGSFAVAVNDYATLSYANEFVKACKILKIPYALGYHIDCKPLFKEKSAVLYGYGASYKGGISLDSELLSFRKQRKDEVLKKLNKINTILKQYGLTIPEKEVSKKKLFTEKHIAKKLAKVLIDKFGKDEELLAFLSNSLGIKSCEGDLRFLKEQQNSYFVEDLAKVLYLKYPPFQARSIKNDVDGLVKLNEKYGVISSYKLKLEKFDSVEFEFIANTLINHNIYCITLTKDLLSDEDLDKTINFFMERGILVVSHYRLGLPRQHMPIVEESYKLFINALVVIGNSISVSINVDDGFYGKNTKKLCPDYKKRVEIFSNIGRRGK